MKNNKTIMKRITACLASFAFLSAEKLARDEVENVDGYSSTCNKWSPPFIIEDEFGLRTMEELSLFLIGICSSTSTVDPSLGRSFS